MLRKILISELFCYVVGFISSVSLWSCGVDLDVSMLFLIAIDTICSCFIIVVNSKVPSENVLYCIRKTFTNFWKIEILDVFIIRPIFLFLFISSLGLVAGEIVGSFFADIMFWTGIYILDTRKIGVNY
jgi:hypothetical protein